MHPASNGNLRVLITADAELPVPPLMYGGIERVIDLLVRELSSRGHEVALVAHRGSQSPASTLYAWPNDSSRGAGAVMRNAAALRRAVIDFDPDVIHSFSRLLWLLPLCMDQRPKLMSYQREPTGRTVGASRTLHRGRLHFTGCSESICRRGRLAGGGDWTAIHNAVDGGSYQFRESVPGDAPLVFLSRIEEIKGCHHAIEIAKRSGRRLVIAGNHVDHGEAGAYWRDRILPEIGRNHVEYAGPVDDAQKNELLGAAAALVVPIEWDEPFGIVFAEALACGTPVISAPRGALPEIIDDGVHGFLVKSIEEGVAAVQRIASISRSACRARFDGAFSAPVIVDAYVSLYRRLIAEHRGGRSQ
jgi:glycosyltransferase involved in cell wall biosynthesis